MRKLYATTMLALVGIAACSSSHASTQGHAKPQSTSFPLSIGATVIPARPRRVVSMSATGTEMLYAVGAGGQVVAVDKYSTYPAKAPRTQLSDFDPNIEGIAALHPDLVVLSDDASAQISAGLSKLKIPAITLPPAASIDDAYRQIDEVGLATGHSAAAADEVSSMRRAIDGIVRSVGSRATGMSYYHELDQTLYSATSRTFIGQLYSRLGMVDIADAAPRTAAGKYPQLSAEYVLQRNPDYVFLADTVCCAQTAASFAARPGFAELAAVKEHHVFPVADDVASHWGPRIVDFLRLIAQAVAGSSR